MEGELVIARFGNGPITLGKVCDEPDWGCPGLPSDTLLLAGLLTADDPFRITFC